MVILIFAIGQLAVDQVAQCVVGVFDAVVFFEAVATGKVVALSFCRFVGKDVVGGVEGEGFAATGLAVAGFLNASDFVVNVMEDAASLVGALDQVAGFVVDVAAVDGASGQRGLFAAPNGTLALRDYHECRSSLSVCRFGRCGNRRGIGFRLGCYGRLGLRVRSCLGRCRYRCSCLCRCTPATGGCRPRRSGCVWSRCSSRQVCLGALWKAFCRTGHRRRSRFRYCRRAF